MKTNEIKSNKLPFEEISIGMKFYKFDENDPDRYYIYYVIKKFMTREKKQFIRIKDYETNEVINLEYDEYLNTNKYTLINNYIKWYYLFDKKIHHLIDNFYKFHHTNQQKYNLILLDYLQNYHKYYQLYSF